MIQKQLFNPVISLRLPEEKIAEINQFVSKFAFKTRTEFFERAVDSYIEELQTAKVVQIRELSKEQAKTEILNYLKGHQNAYVSDMADELGIGIELAFATVRELAQKRKVEAAYAT